MTDLDDLPELTPVKRQKVTFSLSFVVGAEYFPVFQVYKLTIIDNPDIVQGLISFTVKVDHVYMYLLESAPFNLGKNKLYEGVPGNLLACACRVSFQRGAEGFVSFESKTKLIDHYVETLGAFHLGGHLMVIDMIAARRLVDRYFKPK